MEQEEPKKIGRPPEPFDEVVAEAICDLIMEGMPLRDILEKGSRLLQDEEGRNIMMPSRRVFFRWLRQNDSFREQYARSKEEAADARFEELDHVADEAVKESKLVDPKASGAVVQAYRLKADNLKWYMSKMKPKKYGEKLDLTSGGKRIKQAPAIVSSIKPRNIDATTETETTTSG